MVAPEIPGSDAALDRRMVAHDLWPRRLIERRAGEEPTLPARVWWPRDTGEVQQLVARARAEDRALVPFGAGSGVCAGVSPDRRAWILDLKRLNQVVELDEERALVTVEAGMIGERLERWLNARGWSLGHFPSSIYCSTVGGWVAARSAGQLSSRYGKIEDLLFGFEAVDGTGQLLRARLDDNRTGAAAIRLLVGSEGGLCVFTQLTLRVHRLATHRWLRGFVFPELEPALAGMRGLFARGEAPSVLRLYDPLDTWLAGAPPEAREEPDRIHAGGIACAGLERSGPEEDDDDSFLEQLMDRVDRLALFQRPRVTRELVGELLARPILVNTALGRAGGTSKLIVGIEGDGDEVTERAARIRKHLSAAGGVDAGSAPGVKWLLHRHRVSYKMARAFAAGGWVDTMEVATGWGGVLPLYREVRRSLRDVAIVMCHYSHAYLDGCSLYFTFAGGGRDRAGPRSAAARYDLAWERALAAVRAHGAVLSHHHGVGRSKRSALRRDSASQALLTELKDTLDPDDILNPGVVGLGRDRDPVIDLDVENHLISFGADTPVVELARACAGRGYFFPGPIGDFSAAELLRGAPIFGDAFVARARFVGPEDTPGAGVETATFAAPRAAVGPDLIGALLVGAARPTHLWVRVFDKVRTGMSTTELDDSAALAARFAEVNARGRAFLVAARGTTLVELGPRGTDLPEDWHTFASCPSPAGRALNPADAGAARAALDDGALLIGAPFQGRAGVCAEARAAPVGIPALVRGLRGGSP